MSRTSVITMLAIGGVALAGSAAIAANIGILNSTDDGEIGSLAAGDLEPSTTVAVEEQIIDVFLDETTVPAPSSSAPSTTAAPAAPADDRLEQQFTVDDAGTVTLATAEGLLQVTDISPTDGWTATAKQDRLDALTITFTDGQRTIVLAASLAPDGTIVADVTEPIVVVETTPAAPAVQAAPAAPVSATPSGDDQYDDDHDQDEYEYDDDDDHDENEYDDDDHDEYDDDDDHDEYEGRDDDD